MDPYQDIISHSIVRRLFDYRDGKLYWAISPSNRAPLGSRAGAKVKPTRYNVIKINNRNWFEHQLVYLYFYGTIPRGLDHISDNLTEEGIKSNRIENLRCISHGRNIQKGRRVWGRSLYRGVNYKKGRNKWRAFGCLNYKQHHLGYYDDEESAARAYDEFARKNFGEYCFVNFPKARRKI